MEKQDILDYVSKTPENVNVNVLGGMLDALTSGGGGNSGTLLLHETVEDIGGDKEKKTLDKTWKEIKDVFSSGTLVTILRRQEYEEEWKDSLDWVREVGYSDVTDEDGNHYFIAFAYYPYYAPDEDSYPYTIDGSIK